MSEESLSQYCDMNNIDEWNLSNIISVEQYFQISHHALLIRLLNNKLISKKEFDEYKDKYISYEARIRGYGDELYRPSPKEDQYMTLGKYINTIEYLDETNKLSQSKKKEFLFDGYRGDLVFNVDKGDDVKWLQSKLNEHSANLVIDGSFGRKTEEAVKKFQTECFVNGVVDTNTLEKL